MISENELKPCLESLASQHPKHVTQRLAKGSKVEKSWGLAYEIDDPNLDKRLGDFPEGAVPYTIIHGALKNSLGGILAVFGGSPEAPFSRAYEAGVGECLEKAILVQLSAQRGRDAFLIHGWFVEDDDVCLGSHAYNVVFKDGKPFLIDAQNPLVNSEGKSRPYIAPILGINEEHGEFEFVVPQEWKQGRTYLIF
jgi:hypothetical protein